MHTTHFLLRKKNKKDLLHIHTTLLKILLSVGHIGLFPNLDVMNIVTEKLMQQKMKS